MAKSLTFKPKCEPWRTYGKRQANSNPNNKVNATPSYILIFICCLATSPDGNGQQIPISNNFTYQQTFNSLTQAGPWSNGTTLNGWYAASQGDGLYQEYKTSAGASGDNGLYSFGTDNTDRALGSINQDISGNIAYGALFSNNSGATLNSVTISLRAEQWRKVETNKKGYQRVKVSYQVGNVIDLSAIGILSGVFQDVPEANLITLDTTKSTASMNGNSVGNFATLEVRIPVVIPNGSKFFLRFLDENGFSVDAALAVDDLVVSFSSASIDQLSVTSDYSFNAYLDQGILIDIPGDELPNVYTIPLPQDIATWSSIMSDFFLGNASEALSNYGYGRIRFTRSGAGATYEVLRRNSNSSFYWGTYARNIQPLNPIITIQAPHPIKDRDTERQATSIFEYTGASALMVAGTDRCNSNLFSDCVGTTDACSNNEKYRRSDVAHDVENIFHLSTVVLATLDPAMKFIQLHGFSQEIGDPEFVVSAGLHTSMYKSGIDYAALFREALLNSSLPDKGIKIPHLDNYTKLAAQDNVQGRFLNEYPEVNLCTNNTDPVSVTNRFLHIEQYKTVRIDPNFYQDIASIINAAVNMSNAYVPYLDVPNANSTYHQDFNALSHQGQQSTWANDITLNGWHASHQSAGMFGEYQVNDGSSADYGIYSFGELQDTDRSFGSLTQNESGDIVYGVMFRNTSGSAIGNISLSYRAEQWRVSTNIAHQRVRLSYAILPFISPTPSWLFDNDNFTSIPEGDLRTFHSGSLNGQRVSGNQDGNYATISTIIPALLNEGEYLFIRFYDDNAAGTDHALALDDFQITFTPQTTVQFATASASVIESAGNFDIAFTISNPSSTTPTQFELQLSAGNNGDIADFTNVHIEVPPNQSSWTETIEITDDNDPDPGEVFTFQISDVTGGSKAISRNPSSFELTIEDNDVNTVSFVASSASIPESYGVYEVQVMLSQHYEFFEPIKINLVSTTGDETDIDDQNSFVITFSGDNNLLGIASIPITDDLIVEDDETFVFEIQIPPGSNSLPGIPTNFVLTIQRNDIPGIIVNELLSSPSTGPKGDANQDGLFSETADEFIEIVNTESVPVELSGWRLGDSQTRFIFPPSTILNPGEAFVIFGGYIGVPPDRINGSRVFFANENGLNLSNTGGELHIWNSDGILIAKQLYDQSTSDKSFSRIPDLTGTFSVHPHLSGKEYSPGMKSDGSVFVTQIGFQEIVATVLESEETYELHIICRRSANTTSDVNLDLVLVDGNSQHIGNFVTAHINIPPGVTDLVVPIAITNNEKVNGPQRFTFQLQNAAGVYPQLLLPDTFTLTVADDDQSSVSFDIPSATIKESDETYTLLINVINPSTDNSTSVDVVLSHGSNHDVGGFTTQQIHFPPNETRKELTLTITDDSEVEPDETFLFKLQNAEQQDGVVGVGENDTFILTISENDRSLIINEVHGSPSAISPPATGHGDANGDKIRTSTADEFIEFVNTMDTPLDISGWVVKTGIPPIIRHTFQENTIVPARASLVLFGGQTPTGNFGGSLVQVCNATDVANFSAAVTNTNGLIANNGARISVQDRDGTEITFFDSPPLGTTTSSLTRNPDISGILDLASTHPLFDKSFFSPGTKIDGTPFITSIQFQKGSDVASEEDGNYNIILNLTLTKDPPKELEFDLELVNGNSADLGDFSTRHLKPGPEETSMEVPVVITNDGLKEPSEEFIFQITNVTGGFYTSIPSNQFKLNIETPTATEHKYSRISIHPNPASTTLTVTIPDLQAPYDFTLLNIQGQEVGKLKDQHDISVLDIRNLPNGIYIYRVVSSEDGDPIDMGKVWIQR